MMNQFAELTEILNLQVSFMINILNTFVRKLNIRNDFKNHYYSNNHKRAYTEYIIQRIGKAFRKYVIVNKN